MVEQFDLATYNLSKEVTIKISISIPYATESEDFVRVDGIFEYQGEFYRKVKQRLLHDTLEIVCVKDQELAYINQAWSSYVKTFTDNRSEENSNTKSYLTFIKDYLSRDFSILQSSTGWEYEVVPSPHFRFLISDFHPSIIHPPERA
jgi:hypothetical protein